MPPTDVSVLRIVCWSSFFALTAYLRACVGVIFVLRSRSPVTTFILLSWRPLANILRDGLCDVLFGSYSGCVKCGLSSKGQRSCCGKGGSWEGKCGPPGSAKFEHTWDDGIEACSTVMTPKIGTMLNTFLRKINGHNR